MTPHRSTTTRSARRRSLARAARWVAAGLVVAACAHRQPPVAGGARGGERARLSASARCSAAEVERRPLRLEQGGATYVEPQAFLATADGLLLAGAPTYRWPPGAGRATDYVRDEILGVFLEGASTRTLRAPPGLGAIADVRVTEVGRGRTEWLFRQTSPAEDGTERTVALSRASLTGAGWSDVGPLSPLPGGGSHLSGSSALVGLGADLAWTVPVSRRGIAVDVLLYRRRGGVWTATSLGGAAVETDWVEATQAAYGPGGAVWIAVTGQEDELGAAVSTRLIRPGDPPVVRRVHTQAPGGRIRFPRMAAIPGGIALAWLAVEASGQTSAMGFVDRPDASAPTVATIDPSAVWIVPAYLSAVGPLWIVDHLSAATGSRELRVYHHPPGALPRLAGSVPNPYTGYFAAAAPGESELVLVGPEVREGPPFPTVRSLFLHFSVSCD